jgi:hypothetical protein
MSNRLTIAFSPIGQATEEIKEVLYFETPAAANQALELIYQTLARNINGGSDPEDIIAIVETRYGKALVRVPTLLYATVGTA